MMKKNIIFILVFLFLSANVFAAGNNDTSAKEDNYKKGYNLIKNAEKLEKKNKVDASIKKYKQAIKYLTIENKDKPNQADTLNYLGYASRKVGDFEIAEKFYLEGLALDPQHIGINEYLGELYVQTGRLDNAKERLKVLENCSCNEYDELKEIIKGTKKNKY